MQFSVEDIDLIIKECGFKKEAVIPILQAIQGRYNYLPEKALKRVCEITEITPDLIFGVASFYSQFRFNPTGKHLIKVCTGTACHVKGAVRVYDAFKRELNLGHDQNTDKKGLYTIEKVNCLGCCTLAPVVQIDNVTYGHVTTGQIAAILRDFETQFTKGGKRIFKKGSGEPIKGEIRVGLGSCCVASGSEVVHEKVVETIHDLRLDVKLKHVGCVGMCHQVPLMEVIPDGKEPALYAKVNPLDVKSIIEKHFQPAGFFKRLSNKFESIIEKVQYDSGWNGVESYALNVRDKHVSLFLGKQIPVATEFRGVLNPLDIDEYIKKKGFAALKLCLSELSPQDIVDEIIKSGLRGRGGAGFPSGEKWQLVANQNSAVKYVICNGDEGDPGAFMDRMLLESYPYRVIEGMTIAARATGAAEGIFYIRAEYPLAISRITQALEICRQKAFLGKNIMGSDFSFDIRIYKGAGAFVCGEETALIASIEGNRGFPSYRPPFPAESGLWDKPTLVNNTETLAQVPYIIYHGHKKFSSIGTQGSRGTKVFSLAGKINRGGLIEVPMGITIREVVEEIGGGVPDGKKFKAVQIGGPSGGCIPEWLADTKVDFDSLKEVGSMMGSGGFVVLDESDCMVDIAKYFLSFTQNESCGKCTFCRIGTKRMLDILEKISSGQGKESDLKDLEDLAEWTAKGSLCGLGKTAPNPVLSTLKYFRHEYEEHIKGKCPVGKCKDLITYFITDDCIGCTKCYQDCPSGAIPFTPHEIHVIDTEKCIKCDACRLVCPVDAVITK